MTTNRGLLTFGLLVALVAGVSRNGDTTVLGASVAPSLSGCCKAHQSQDSGESDNAANENGTGGEENGSVQQGNENIGGNDENAGGNEQNGYGPSGNDDANGGGEGGNTNE